MTDDSDLVVEDSGGRWRLAGPCASPFALVNEFLAYLEDRNYSPRTVRAYAFDLLHFARWLAGQGLVLDEVTTDVMLRFLAACRETVTAQRPGGNVYSIADGRNARYAPATVNRRLAAISGLFGFRQMRDPDAVMPVPRGREGRRAGRGERTGLLGHLARPRTRSGLRVREPRRLPRGLDRQETAALLGSPPANAPEASVAADITADLDAAGRTLAELHIDRAYLSSPLVRDRSPGLAIFCKAWRVRNTGGRYAKDQFTPDFETGQLTCPAGVSMPFWPGKTVHFPKDTCAACPLRRRCTSSGNGRSVSVHPDEELLAELRRRQQTTAGRAKLRERVKVEHALAHVGHWQGRRARYRGTRKNLFDLRRVAVVHNLHVIARQTAPDYQLAA